MDATTVQWGISSPAHINPYWLTIPPPSPQQQNHSTSKNYKFHLIILIPSSKNKFLWSIILGKKACLSRWWQMKSGYRLPQAWHVVPVYTGFGRSLYIKHTYKLGHIILLKIVNLFEIKSSEWFHSLNMAIRSVLIIKVAMYVVTCLIIFFFFWNPILFSNCTGTFSKWRG
jgi:hypothetical protein